MPTRSPSVSDPAGDPAPTLQHFDLFAYRFSFETDEPAAANALGRLYGDHRIDPPHGDGSTQGADRYCLFRRSDASSHPAHQCEWTVQNPHGPSANFEDLGDALDAVQYEVTAMVTEADHHKHVIHAAVVYGPAGDLLISGVSGAGKSTLSLALSARGLRVGGDDVALIEPESGLLHPVPRCFHLDGDSLRLLNEVGFQVPPSSLPGFPIPQDWWSGPPKPASIRFVFLLDPKRVASPELTQQTQAEMVAALLMETSRAGFSDMDGIRALSQIAGGCQCYRVRSGTLQDTVEAILRKIR